LHCIWWSQRGYQLHHNMTHTSCILDKQGYTYTCRCTRLHARVPARPHTQNLYVHCLVIAQITVIVYNCLLRKIHTLYCFYLNLLDKIYLMKKLAFCKTARWCLWWIWNALGKSGGGILKKLSYLILKGLRKSSKRAIRMLTFGLRILNCIIWRVNFELLHLFETYRINTCTTNFLSICPATYCLISLSIVL
jgi:hypothetical protein